MPGFVKAALRKISMLIVCARGSEAFAEYLRSAGVQVGTKTAFFAPATNFIDTTAPWMLRIGSYCKITRGVVILAHDYSRSVLRRSHGAILAEGKDTVIGDNVFIGMNAVILAGAHLGSNVIVGAGSVVAGSVPDNVVVAGNPARVIRTMDEHYEVRKRNNLKEAKNRFRLFKERNGRRPTIKEMGHFFPLFCHTEQELLDADISLAWSGDEKDEILQSFLGAEHPYENYEAFCRDCEDEGE
jgi:acetyltransferase-like isoleucine patch superfamily enzyme